MKKIVVSIIVLVLCLFYYMNSNRILNKKLFEFRNRFELTKTERFKYGDLYDQTYLPNFKIENSKSRLKTIISTKGKKTKLILFSDSYTYRKIEPKHLFNVESINYIKWYDPNSLINIKKLDQSKNNIIVIEIVERSFREIFSNPSAVYSLLRKGDSVDLVQCQPQFFKAYVSCIFEPKINRNIENNLFDLRFFNQIKEQKARFNLKLFNRITGDAVLSNNGDYLFYKPTINEDLVNSSFNKISDSELSFYVQGLNELYFKFKSMGFNEIYLSIIPNPVSILEPDRGNYNHLIEKIQLNKNLKMSVIDIYSVFKMDSSDIYLKNDSHWTNKGFQIWVDFLNKNLVDYNSRKP